MDATVPRPIKFRNPEITATGKPRAHVALRGLATLWFNTGTLCNLTCGHCYIESSPRNDRLQYLAYADMVPFLDEIRDLGLPTREIGFTGGEPFMNPDIFPMLETALDRGFDILVLTNAMRPMMRASERLARLIARAEGRLTLRVSLDHYTREVHEGERGKGAWEPTVTGLKWLSGYTGDGLELAVAGRHFTAETETDLRAGYATLFAREDIHIDAGNPAQLILFPEMDVTADVPEITTACWNILEVSPSDMMCATSRMVVRRKGSERPGVVACTLLPYDPQFELGGTLAEAAGEVSLNHPHCAQFCVLGGGSCSAGE